MLVQAEESSLSIQASEMAALKFTGFIFLVYFAIFANAGRRFCRRADQKLADLKTMVENIDCSGQSVQGDLFSFFIIVPRFHSFNFPLYSITLAID